MSTTIRSAPALLLLPGALSPSPLRGLRQMSGPRRLGLVSCPPEPALCHAYSVEAHSKHESAACAVLLLRSTVSGRNFKPRELRLSPCCKTGRLAAPARGQHRLCDNQLKSLDSHQGHVSSPVAVMQRVFAAAAHQCCTR